MLSALPLPWNLVYKVRRKLPTDKRRSPVFVNFQHPHLIVVGILNFRILLNRYGPRWWVLLNRVECWKYWRAQT